MTAPRFELTSQRQKVSRLQTEPPGRPVQQWYSKLPTATKVPLPIEIKVTLLCGLQATHKSALLLSQNCSKGGAGKTGIFCLQQHNLSIQLGIFAEELLQRLPQYTISLKQYDLMYSVQTNPPPPPVSKSRNKAAYASEATLSIRGCGRSAMQKRVKCTMGFR